MTFPDLSEVYVAEPFVLPIRGKQYAFPGEISARSMVRLMRLTADMREAQRDAQGGQEGVDARELLSDEDEADVRRQLFGGLEDELVADNCTPSELRIVFFTLIAFHLYGTETAEAIWNNAGKAPAPKRTTRRSKTPAKSTRRRGSPTGSTSHPAPPGRKSSRTGTQ